MKLYKRNDYKLNVVSDAYKRITEAGFKINYLEVFKNIKEFMFRASFTCVCNEIEFLQYYLPVKDMCGFVSEDKTIDVAHILETCGAVSEAHLREDGFSEEDIKCIRIPYERLKASVPDRAMA